MKKQKIKRDEFVVFVKPFTDGRVSTYQVGTIAQKFEEQEGCVLVRPQKYKHYAVWVPSYCVKPATVWPEI